MKIIRSVLLGHRDIAIDRWRTGKVYDNWILGGILSRETAKKGRAHVDTSRDELGCVTRQWWKRLVGRLQQIDNS